MIVLDGDEFLTVEEAATLLGIKRQRLYRRAEVEALLRVAPAGGPVPLPSHGDRPRKRRIPDIPLAESWIRE